MIKLKLLKPSHKEKKRYVVYEVSSMDSVNMRSFQDNLVLRIQSLLGVFQSAQAGLQTVKYDAETKRGILRVNHLAVDLIRSCFVLIDKVGNQHVTITTRGVSGILKKAKEYM